MALTLTQALTIVDVALKKGRETSCAPLAVAVLDAGGHLKAFGREDGAGIIRPQISMGKAWGALGMGVGSRALAKRLTDNPGAQPFFAAFPKINAVEVALFELKTTRSLVRDGQYAVSHAPSPQTVLT